MPRKIFISTRIQAKQVERLRNLFDDLYPNADVPTATIVSMALSAYCQQLEKRRTEMRKVPS